MLKFLGSAAMMASLMVLLVVALAVATFLGDGFIIYHSWLLFALEALLVVNFVAMSLRRRVTKWGVQLLHLGFVVVLIGAMTTHLFGFEGVVHIRAGQTTNQIINNRGEKIGELPFSITLQKFTLERYSGSGSPSSYESELIIDGQSHRAYMNNVVHKAGWRLYQSSYDKDEQGTVLSVNADVAGTAITYIGYLMLVVGFLWSFLGRTSRFRSLIRSLGVVALLLAADGAVAQSSERDVEHEKRLALVYAHDLAAPDSVGTSFGRLMVQTPAGRIEPVDTYARELLRKLYRDTQWQGLSATQSLIGMLSQGYVWSRVPIIKTSHFAGKDYISFIDILDDQGNYILADQVDQVYAKSPALRNKADKELLKLDEKVNILNAIFTGRMVSLFPLEGDKSHHWYSVGDDLSVFAGQDSMFVSRIMPWYLAAAEKGEWATVQKVTGMIDIYQQKKSAAQQIDPNKIKAEIFYNQVEPFKWSSFAYMALGLLLVGVLIVKMLSGSTRLSSLIWALSGLVVAVFLLHSSGMGLRWYISERAPWTNSYESMVYVGWATALAGLLFSRKSMMTFALSTFFAGVILLVSNMSSMDPQITPLVPVLKSYWLVVHVAVITASYGFFGVGFLLGAINLCFMAFAGKKFSSQIRELTTINELALWIGLALMTIGTFLGAVWANESWGRYWGWDPKETWALITVLFYAVVLHLRFIPKLFTPWSFNLLSTVALGTVLMTFFGVNYYLTGLHSYGSDGAPPAISIIWVVYGTLSVVAFLAYRRTRLK
ncbi:MAG: cytochrome c biogenesis protein CcsA [Mucinivorans sp.]